METNPNYNSNFQSSDRPIRKSREHYNSIRAQSNWKIGPSDAVTIKTLTNTNPSTNKIIGFNPNK